MTVGDWAKLVGFDRKVCLCEPQSLKFTRQIGEVEFILPYIVPVDILGQGLALWFIYGGVLVRMPTTHANGLLSADC